MPNRCLNKTCTSFPRFYRLLYAGVVSPDPNRCNVSICSFFTLYFWCIKWNLSLSSFKLWHLEQAWSLFTSRINDTQRLYDRQAQPSYFNSGIATWWVTESTYLCSSGHSQWGDHYSGKKKTIKYITLHRLSNYMQSITDRLNSSLYMDHWYSTMVWY